MLKIRRPIGRLIFNMGIAIPGKAVFLIETPPWYLLPMSIIFAVQLIIETSHEQRKCLFNSLFRLTTKISKLYINRWFPHKGPVMRRACPCHYIIIQWHKTEQPDIISISIILFPDVRFSLLPFKQIASYFDVWKRQIYVCGNIRECFKSDKLRCKM